MPHKRLLGGKRVTKSGQLPCKKKCECHDASLGDAFGTIDRKLARRLHYTFERAHAETAKKGDKLNAFHLEFAADACPEDA